MNNFLDALKNRRNFLIGMVIVSIFVFMAIFAQLISPYDPFYDADLNFSDTAPNLTFWFGTDVYGRDILSRIIHGAQISMSVGLLTQLVNTIIGIVLGLLAGYFGGWCDDIVNGLTNVMLAIPSLVFALAIMALIGPGLINIFIAISLTNWSYTCRIVRSQTMITKNLGYVRAAESMGFSDIHIMFRQILPNIAGPILVISTLGMGGAILMEASLSFLGLGAQPPIASWGSMLSDAREQFFTAPWIAIFPGLAIFLVVLGLNLVGDGLRDMFDPHNTGN